jgi:DNA modification methylase
MFTEPGDLLAEPFAGSGSIIIACKNLGRNIIASEINEETYNIAKANIDNNINKL